MTLPPQNHWLELATRSGRACSLAGCMLALLCSPIAKTGAATNNPNGQVSTDVAQPQSSPPAAAESGNGVTETGADEAVDFFKRHFYPYEPFYFVAGPDSPNAKFQFSFKYQLFDEAGALARRAPFVSALFFAYTQTSLWDLNKPSAPFEDSSYMPEFMFRRLRLAGGGSNEWFRLDVQAGFQHESNGRGGAESRSLNIAYVRPTVVLGRDGRLQLTLSPRAWFYVGGLDDNPDLAEYRGHADLRATVGWTKNAQLALLARGGDGFDRGSIQLDLTYPLNRVPKLGLTWYLQAQYFTGYGESLLHYNERSTAWRFGFAIFR